MTPSAEVPQTVLLVEDNVEVRKLVQHILEAGGFEVLVAADASAAATNRRPVPPSDPTAAFRCDDAGDIWA